MSDHEAPNSIRSFSGALQGLGIGFLLVFMALTHLDLGGYHIGFILLPVATIYLWPVHASYSWSLLCIFLLGIFHDLASDGPLGVWAISYLLLFLIMGRGVGRHIAFGQAMGGFALSLLFVAVVSYGFGFVALGASPNIGGMLVSILTALLFFPLLYWVRHLFGTLNNDMTLRRKP